MHRSFRSGLIVCGALALALGAGCGKKSTAGPVAATASKQPVEVVNLTRRDLAETLGIVGSLAANESATIRPEITGLVRAIGFDEGQQVKRGQLLAKIDDAELRAQVTQSEARFELAKLNLQRAENLQQTQANTKADMDRAHSEFATAQADLELLKVRLDRTEIKAPFDGIVGSRTLSPGDYVNTLSVVTTIDDLSRMKIEFQVPERFFSKVVPGTKFIVSARSAGNTGKSDLKIPGEVYFVSSSIERATRSSQVKGYLTGAPESLKPGMFANVELVLSVKQGALTVPEGAILTTPRGTQIIAVRDEKGEKVADFVAVNVGLRSKGLVEIQPVNGRLDDQQAVVASGVGALILFPGAKLEPRPQKEQFRIGGGE
ncbi:MAG: efflux RND transporter periplasmic adaptor subunit [Lacunisphaera sp.]|nr:efflux RND transporter periplasmic adaptor subunit [Lacunisphaera sp.]